MAREISPESGLVAKGRKCLPFNKDAVLGRDRLPETWRRTLGDSGLAQVGFGRASLAGTYKTDTPVADEIDVRVLVARDDGAAAALAVADFGLLWPAMCARLRQAVAEALDVPAECLGIFTTQNHGVLSNDCKALDAGALERAFVSAARAADAAIAPAQVAAVSVPAGPGLVYCRRVHLEPFGAMSFWFGYRLEADGRADVSHILKLALKQLSEGRMYQRRFFEPAGEGDGAYDVPDAPIPVPHPLWLPPALDDRVQGLFFRTPGGRPIGSLVRIAAHPNTANVGSAGWHSGDYPVYVRRRLQGVFGGGAIFLTGPCGDQATGVERKSLALAEKVGRQVADAALAALPRAQWVGAAPVRAASPTVRLHIREDYPCCRETAGRFREALEARFRDAVAAGRPLAELKRISDQWEMYLYVTQGNHQDWTGLDLTGQAGLPLPHPLFVMRIGPAVLAGLPGEPFGRISSRLRDETIGESLIVCEEANGYLSYIPTADELAAGGYGPNAVLFDGRAEQTLIDGVKAGLKEAFP